MVRLYCEAVSGLDDIKFGCVCMLTPILKVSDLDCPPLLIDSVVWMS